jgi:hypothetical protein
LLEELDGINIVIVVVGIGGGSDGSNSGTAVIASYCGRRCSGFAGFCRSFCPNFGGILFHR